ncbi:hypothetical protein FACS1894190_16580 [Spirochaetia bacterium]|nr:hypothetical protein FACS1894190_16580 [Spirochaetia bacterium]
MKKTEILKILIVPFAIYILLFFPTSTVIGAVIKNIHYKTSILEFSIKNELFRLSIYTIPSFLIIVFFYYRLCIFNNTDFGSLFLKRGKNGKILLSAFLKDCGFAAAVFSGLFVVCFSVNMAQEFFSGAAPVQIGYFGARPLSIFMLSLSCLGTGFLEEIFFRGFLPFSLKRVGAPLVLQFFLSGALFGLCHIWEGYYGVLSAFLSGIFLSFVFYKQKSLTTISLGHAAYNFVIWIAAALK